MLRHTRLVFPALLTAACVLGAFFWFREAVSTRIYQEKLAALATEYASLAEHYNHAVRQSAITELEVTADSVTVLVRTVDGAVRRIPTPFDPRREIYVDYLVGDGRIWIRRLFDNATPPGNGMVIDPVWETVDWRDAGLRYGKAVYRTLDPGLWSIQVSGSGALSLEPVPASRRDELVAMPEIRSFEEIRLSLDEDTSRISWTDMWNFCKNLWR
jgi:hypothetical protein